MLGTDIWGLEIDQIRRQWQKQLKKDQNTHYTDRFTAKTPREQDITQE